MVHPVHDADFGDVVLGAGRPVLVAFHAQWCASSSRMMPVVEALAAELDWITFTRLDVDLEPVTSAAYRVTSLPALLVFCAGELVLSIVGVRPGATVRELLVTLAHDGAQKA